MRGFGRAIAGKKTSEKIMNIDIPQHVTRTLEDRAERIMKLVGEPREAIERALREAWAEGYMVGRRQGDDPE